MIRLLLALLLATPLLAKELHWRAIDVTAHVEADGDLHIVERQAMVFTGDWNGGERNFNVRDRQRLTLHSVKKIDGGVETTLSRGDLAEVDRYDFTSRDVLRWRSRLPTDSPFQNRELTYVLDYTLGNALVGRGDNQYRLAHDFGLPERAGVVEQFTLQLTFDPAWSPVEPVTITRASLPPGESVVVDRDLTFVAAGVPAGIDQPMPSWIPTAVLASVIAISLLLFAVFYLGDKAVGRFAPVAASAAHIDEVLQLPAEVAGAVWDGDVGPPEVSATLARMQQEGKLETAVKKKNLHIEMLVDRQELEGHERRLISDLFPTGGTKTNTEEIRSHYRRSGFDPSKSIADGINERLEAISDWKAKPRRAWAAKYLLLFPLAIGFLIWTAMRTAAPDAEAIIFGGIVIAFAGLFATAAAFAHASYIHRPVAVLFRLTIPYVAMLFPVVGAVLRGPERGLHPLVLVAMAVWHLVWLALIFDLLRIRELPSKIALRKRVAGVRRYFQEELKKPQPNLRDEWFPYLLAFGLGKNADRWFRAHGAPSTRGSTSSSSWSSGSSSSSSSSPSGWTGGGGAFGGAGATGGWAVAAGAMAAGVSAPSSSGSGGGGGGSSSSSSGGGGGGGW